VSGPADRGWGAGISAPGDFYRPEIQTLSREEIVATQEFRLRDLLARVFDQPVPFFKRKLEAAGVGPDDVKTLDDLRRVPSTTKAELRESEAAHPPLGDYRGAPLERCIRLGTSTGTTGRPTIMLFTRHDLDVEHDAAARMFWRQGYRPGDVITHAHPGGLYGGQALLGGALEAFGALNVAVGPPVSKADAERAIALWKELRPTGYEMFGPPRHLFWDTAIEMGLDPREDLGMPEPEEVIPWRTFSAGIECFAFLGSSCGHSQGSHLCEDEAIVEVVDPATGEPVAEGERGTEVVTTLTKDNFMLRYDLQDVVRLDRSPCPCGETHARGFWDGRAADLVRAGDRELLPIDVSEALGDVEEVTRPALEFQMVRSADAAALRVRVETRDPNATLRARVTGLLNERLGVPAEVDLVETGALPRPAYKPARVVDE
jgi:phenylacetate-CoA ligase